MTSCGPFVSLLRSCYKTTARFFRDDLTVEEEVKWYFTHPDAPWIGIPNIFNARTWYGGVINWPDLGEIEGAARQWSSGGAVPLFNTGVHGSPEQWDHGALKSEALNDPPCGTFLGNPPFPERGGEVIQERPVGPIDLGPLVRQDNDRFYFLVFSGTDPDGYLTVSRITGPTCGFPSSPDYELTVGPPTFNPWPHGGVTGVSPAFGCLETQVNSINDFGIYRWRIVLNPL